MIWHGTCRIPCNMWHLMFLFLSVLCQNCANKIQQLSKRTNSEQTQHDEVASFARWNLQEQHIFTFRKLLRWRSGSRPAGVNASLSHSAAAGTARARERERGPWNPEPTGFQLENLENLKTFQRLYSDYMWWTFWSIWYCILMYGIHM